MNRGNGRMKLFEKRADYLTFLELMEEGRQRTGMRILAFCLMPTHWHMVLWPRHDGDLSAFIRWVATTHVRRWREYRQSVGEGASVPGAVQELSHPAQRATVSGAALRRGQRAAGETGPDGRGLAVWEPVHGRAPAGAPRDDRGVAGAAPERLDRDGQRADRRGGVEGPAAACAAETGRWGRTSGYVGRRSGWSWSGRCAIGAARGR